MDLTQFSLFDMVNRRMSYLGQRQTVLAQNISNADTPGYRPMDLEPFERHLEQAGFGRLQLARTDSRHMLPPGAEPGDIGSDRMGGVYEISPAGNEVVIEQQMIALSEVEAAHSLALNLFTKHMGMMKLALGRS